MVSLLKNQLLVAICKTVLDKAIYLNQLNVKANENFHKESRTYQAGRVYT